MKQLIDRITFKCNDIDYLVENTIISEDVEKGPVLDGIINVEKYCKAKYKILWILKEPYDQDDGKGGWFDLKIVINKASMMSDFNGGRRTFEAITYASYGILNDFCQYENIGDVYKSKEILNSLKSVAIINVKKLPGFKKSKDSEISKAYRDYKDILLRQISDYEPNIIIGGYTLQYFFPDLNILPEMLIKTTGKSWLRYFIKNGRIFIDVYHPSQWNMANPNDYCNDIINAVKEWASI